MKSSLIVFDQWNNIPILDGEGPFVNDIEDDHAHKVHVDTQGWISPQDQIIAFRGAGERLELERKRAVYDFAPGEKIDENYNDPTRAKGYDVVDAQYDLSAVQPALDAVREESRKAEELKQEEAAKALLKAKGYKLAENVEEAKEEPPVEGK